MPKGIYNHKQQTEETKRKIREKCIGRNFGKTYEEIFGVEKAAQMRKAKSEAGKENKFFLGHKHTPETKEKQRFAKLGKKHTLETKEKHSKDMKSRWQTSIWRNSWLEMHSSPERRRRISEILRKKLNSEEVKEKMRGLNNHFYRDGKSNEPYGAEFTDALKLKIRKRDDFMCQWPGCGLPENGKAHHVHHIDHNKHHNSEQNLITLCSKHHNKEKLLTLEDAMNICDDIFRARHIKVLDFL